MTDFTMYTTFLAAATILILSHLVVCDNDHGKIAVSYNTESFKEALNGNRNFVMFYAPWCGHCKNLAPTWEELAKIYNDNEDSPVVIAKVDCTVHTKLCAEHEIMGFPTLKLFPVGGSDPKRYSGKRDLDSLKTYLSHQLNEPASKPVSEEEGDDGQKDSVEADADSDLVQLTDDTFDEHIAMGLHFVKFYAPWCGHCKRLAPTWQELAESFNDNAAVTISKIDCDTNPVSCKKHNVRGYPTLLLFNDAEQIKSYDGDRSLTALTAFVSKELATLQGDEEEPEEGEDEIPEAPEMEDDEQGQVKELTADNFDAFLSTRLVFVKFYAPWCGHCKRLAPVWDDLAKELEEGAVSIAKVDCTLHKPVCDSHQVRGYPTLKIFRDGVKLEDYRQSRTLESMATFVKGFLTPHDEL